MSIKKKNLKNNSAKFHQGLAVTVGLFLFAGFGAYLIFNSKALSPVYHPNLPLYFDDYDKAVIHPVGQNFSLSLYGNIPSATATGSAGKMSLVLKVASVAATSNPVNRVQYQGYVCGVAGSCFYPVFKETSPLSFSDLQTCIDINPVHFGKDKVSVVNLNYKSLFAGTYNIAVSGSWYASSCASTTRSLISSMDKTQFELGTGNYGGTGGTGTDSGTGAGHSGPGPGTGEGTGQSGSGSNAGPNSGTNSTGSSTPKPTTSNQPTSSNDSLESELIDVTSEFTTTLSPDNESKNDSKGKVNGEETKKHNKRSRIVAYVAAGAAITLGIAAGSYWWWQRKRLY